MSLDSRIGTETVPILTTKCIVLAVGQDNPNDKEDTERQIVQQAATSLSIKWQADILLHFSIP
jgi:hypothetical protein